MAIIDHLFERRQSPGSPENPRTNLAEAAFWLIDTLGGGPSKTGVRVTPRSSLSVTAVQAAVRVIAESVGSLPAIVYERLQPRGKRRAIEHALYPILHDRPNPEMTAPVFFETLQAHVLLWGNAFAEIQRNGRGDVIALWPLLPDQTRVGRDADGRKFYVTTVPDGPQIRLGLDEVLHVPGLSYNGREGLSPIGLAREAVGLALASEEYGARFFAHDATPPGVLEHPNRLSPGAASRIRESWQAQHGGLTHAHRIAILEEGMKYHAIGMSHEDAQFLELRKFQVSEIARLFRVPPHMIGDLERATFSNIEHQALEFVVHTLRPWLVRWEKAINLQLFSGNTRGRFFVEFLVDGLLRGDLKSRYEAYAVGRQWGWLSADDVRELENMNPLPDGAGAIYLVPTNMTTPDRILAPPVASAPEPSPAPTDPEDGAPDDQANARAAQRRLRLIAEQAAARLVQREATLIREKAVKLADDPARWRAWVDDFYRDFAQTVGSYLQLEPAVATAYAARHRDALLAEGVGVLERWAIEAPPELVGLALGAEVTKEAA